jgi:O-antigen/teichoic acid export membrane protein
MLLVLRGSAWTIVGYAASQLLRLASVLVLARQLLSPNDFGLVALVTVFLSGLQMLSDLGIGLDVVQHRRGDDPSFINTAFLIQVGRGVFIWAIATLLAYPFAQFYGEPAVLWLVIVAALSTAVRGLASGSVWLMTRHVQLGKLTTLNVSSEAAGFLISVCWAIISPTAWALVAGGLATAVVFTVGSHLMAEHRISLAWDRAAARDVFIFGVGIFLSTATYFLGGEAERLVIGKFISMEELGCLSLALTLSSAPMRMILQVAAQVLFPVMATSIRNDRNAAGRHFRSARFVFLAIGIVVGAGFIAYSHRLVEILLPLKYASTGWMLQLLGFRTGLEIFGAPSSSLFLASGDTKYLAAANIARLLIMVPSVWLAASHFGIFEAVAVLTFAPMIAYPIVIFGVGRHLPRAFWIELACFGLYIAAMGVAAILPWPLAQ